MIAKHAFSHLDGIIGFRDRVQVGQVDYGHGRRWWRLAQYATELDVETVDEQRGRGGRDVGFSSGGDGHDFGLWVTVLAYVVGHDGCGCITRGRHGTAIAAAAVVVVVVDVTTAAAVVVGRASTATAAAFRVSGLCGRGGRAGGGAA